MIVLVLVDEGLLIDVLNDNGGEVIGAVFTSTCQTTLNSNFLLLRHNGDDEHGRFAEPDIRQRHAGGTAGDAGGPQ